MPIRGEDSGHPCQMWIAKDGSVHQYSTDGAVPCTGRTRVDYLPQRKHGKDRKDDEQDDKRIVRIVYCEKCKARYLTGEKIELILSCGRIDQLVSDNQPRLFDPEEYTRTSEARA